MNRKASRQLGIKMCIISTFAVITILSLSVTSPADIIPTQNFILVPLDLYEPTAYIDGNANDHGIPIGSFAFMSHTNSLDFPYNGINIGMTAYASGGVTPDVYARAYAKAAAPPENGWNAADSVAGANYNWWIYIGDVNPTAPANTPVPIIVDFNIMIMTHRYKADFVIGATLSIPQLTQYFSNLPMPYNFLDSNGVYQQNSPGTFFLIGTVPYETWIQCYIQVGASASAQHFYSDSDPATYEADARIHLDPTITIDPSWLDTHGNRDQIYFSTVPPLSNTVPEPATMLLLGSGLIGLAGYGRRKFKK